VTDELPEPDLLSLVSIAGAAVDARVLDGMAEAGFDTVRPAHGYLIQRLVVGPQLISAMAADLGVSQQAMSKMVKEMIRLGLAAQHIDAQDSRRRPVTLTDRGRAAVDKARAVRADLEENLRGAAGADDLAAAQRVVGVLLDQLGLGQNVAQRTVPMPGEG
jgi:DNA-binding MarR family transcriptional regulator